MKHRGIRIAILCVMSVLLALAPFTDAIICSSSFCGFSLLPLLYAALTCEA